MTSRRTLAFGVAGVCVAGLLLGLVPVMFGRPLQRVHLRWVGTEPGQRQALEQRFQLTEPLAIQGDTWAYVPGDTSPAMLRAIVEHPAIAATDGIDRSALRMARNGPLTERRGGWLPGYHTLARFVRLGAYLLLLLGVGTVARWTVLTYGVRAARAAVRARTRLAALLRRATTRARRLASAGVIWVQRGIPELTAATAGAFRLVFVSLVVLYVSRESFDASDIPTLPLPKGGLQALILPWLLRHPQWMNLVSPAVIVCGVRQRAC